MTRIDRYILMLFLRVFGTCYVCLSGLMIVVHLFTNLDDLVDAGKANGNTIAMIIGYYAPYSLSLYTRLCPFFALLAMLGTVSWLKRTHELTALMAAGISKGRILRLPMIAMVCLVLTSSVIREFVLPQHQDILGKQPQDLSGENFRPLKPARDPKTRILLYGHHVELLNEQIINPLFRLPSSASMTMRNIKGHRAVYQQANADHPAGYLMKEVSSPEDISRFDSIIQDNEPVVLTAKQAAWLAPNECFVVSTVPFFLLQGGTTWSQYESTWNIVKRLHTQPTFFGRDIHVTAHTRVVQPLLDLALILFGLPIVLQRVDHHLFWIAGSVMGSVVIFYAVTYGTQAFASSNLLLPCFLGAWLPLMLILPLAWARVRVAMLS